MSSHQVQGLLASYCFPSYCRLRIVSTNIRLLKRKFVSSFPQSVQTRYQGIIFLNLPNFMD